VIGPAVRLAGETSTDCWSWWAGTAPSGAAR